MKVGDKIRERRKELKWSQRELADRIGCDHSTITRIENGKVDVTQTRIRQFSEVLGVPVSYLMNWEQVQQKNDVIADIVVRLRIDDKFLSVVETLNKLDDSKLAGVKQLLNAFEK